MDPKDLLRIGSWRMLLPPAESNSAWDANGTGGMISATRRISREPQAVCGYGDGVTERSVLPPDQYVASLARKRMAATAFFRDGGGRVLLVNPVYKET